MNRSDAKGHFAAEHTDPALNIREANEQLIEMSSYCEARCIGFPGHAATAGQLEPLGRDWP